MQDEYSDLDARIHAFRQSDAQREELLASLVHRLRGLERANKQLARDYEAEQRSRRDWQDQYDQIERQLTTSRHASEVNCFVQVLIDGDASYFHESLIEGGEKGGIKAAVELHKHIKQHIETLFPGSDFPIILHMYANLGGLSGLYTRNGVIASPSQLFVFARGFNSSQDMFNLVDVGTGKEGADHKVREMLRIFMSNKHCKHIIFGGLHDNGYLNVLRPWAHDSEKKQRITLLETLPSQQGFKDLGYPIIAAPLIFKSEQPKATVPIPAAIESSSSPLAIRSASPNTSANATGGATWSARTGTAGNGSIDISPKPAVKPVKYILKNAEGSRLDERLPPVPSTAYESLKKKRAQGGNACNDYYLLGKCHNEYACNFNHEFKLSPGEVNCLKALARNLSCPDLSLCEDFSCYKGHVCLHDLRNHCDKGYDCYFFDVHGIDVRPTTKVFEDGREETI